MEQVTLKATKREGLGSAKCKRLRQEGKLPGVVYGHKEDVVPVMVELAEFEHILDQTLHMLTLDIEGATETVMIREVQYGSLGDDMVHVDFSRISMDETVQVEVVFEFHGDPVGLEEGGVFDVAARDVEVECLPGAIPDAIDVDVSELGIGDVVHIGDIKPPEGVRLLAPEDDVVASVHMQRITVPVVEEEEPELEALEGEAVEGEAAEVPPEGEEPAGESPPEEG